MDGLLEAAQAEWGRLQTVCTFEGSPLRDINIKIDWDHDIQEQTLAWAKYTRILKDGAWFPILLTEHTWTVDVEIGVNPNVEWTLECDGAGWSLKSTLLHELLHALGISSSATAHGIGYGEACTPTLMDTKMRMADGSPAVDGCSLKEGNIYVGSTLLHRGEFQSGVSLNHHVHAGYLMHPTPPYECAFLGTHEIDILETLGYKCDVDPSSLVSTHPKGSTSSGQSRVRNSIGSVFAWVRRVFA